MKFLLSIACVLAALVLTAQKKNDPSELYPVFKSIKIKWDKNTDFLSGPTNVDECMNGNCSEGEGVRLVTGDVEYKYGYSLYGTILKGTFTAGGTRFNGKVYHFKVPVGGYKKEKELRLSTPLDITSDSSLKPFYTGEGEYSMEPAQWNRGWDGAVKDVPALAKVFPNATIHKAMLRKGGISWIDVDLPENHRFIRYTGHTFASGDFMMGKALLDNGDLYEGFFLRHSFHGPGKLIKRSGKILQGIWQLDSLTQEVAVVFPPALLQAVLPAPTPFKISNINNLDVNSFRHSATEISTTETSDFYGEVVNNEASGWGLWKTRFTNQNADSRDDIDGWAYGYWKHNQLEGPGIYFTTPRAGQLSYAGNPTTFMNDFWIRTGVYKNGKIVQGNLLTADYSVHANKDIPVHDIQRLSFDKMTLVTDPLQGCAMKMDFDYSWGYGAKPTIFHIYEGYYNNGALTGFYFDNDKEKKRSYEFFGFSGYHRSWKYTNDVLGAAEKSNDLCFEAMSRYKPLFIAEMKKKLASDLAAEAWEKSPEGQAFKRQAAIDNERYAEQRKKECAAEFAKIGVKGRTYTYRAELVILQDYDCDKKEYIAWRPRQGSDLYSAPAGTQVRGLTGFLLDNLTPSVKQYQTCDVCNGAGKVTVTTSTTRVKELPWGYFSGIETKSIRTTTKQELENCSKCLGMAIILK